MSPPDGFSSFGERPVLKLMFGAMTRAAERWRSIRFTDCERRQIVAIIKDLDAQYENANDTRSHSQTPRPAKAIPSSSRT